MDDFTPKHMNATKEDFFGNQGIGRYVFLPGSDGRAQQIAEKYFENIEIKEHSRRHNLYKGHIPTEKGKIDVASISSGMGTASLDIIVNELYMLGAKRFLRIGTSGLLQPHYMSPGDFVIANAAIKDDGVTQNYLPSEFPSIASKDIMLAADSASQKLNKSDRTHTGIIHSKGSLYAREFNTGPCAKENSRYMKKIADGGAIASEMEAAMLFTLSTIFNHELALQTGGKNESEKVKAGAICVVIGEGSDFVTKDFLTKITEEVVEIGIETIKELSNKELEFNKF